MYPALGIGHCRPWDRATCEPIKKRTENGFYRWAIAIEFQICILETVSSPPTFFTISMHRIWYWIDCLTICNIIFHIHALQNDIFGFGEVVIEQKDIFCFHNYSRALRGFLLGIAAKKLQRKIFHSTIIEYRFLSAFSVLNCTFYAIDPVSMEWHTFIHFHLACTLFYCVAL